MSKSGTLTYQMMFELNDFGFSTSSGLRRGFHCAGRQDDAAAGVKVAKTPSETANVDRKIPQNH